MDVVACIKRVPDTGASIVLTDDQRRVDAANLGYTMSPHEECAIEEAVQQAQAHGGSARVLTLGPEDAVEQLRTGLAMQADEATLLQTDGEEWAPRETAGAIADSLREPGEGTVGADLLLFGNESADMANYQVPVRVASALDLPCVTGIKDLTVEDGTAVAKREIAGGEVVFTVDLPAVISVKEGINEPRYPSMRAKMQARKTEVDQLEPVRDHGPGRFEMVRLETPAEEEAEAEILGEGPTAVGAVVDVLRDEVEVL